MAEKIMECFEAELSKLLGEKNSRIMLDNVLKEINKTRDTVDVQDIPLIWKSIESSLMSLVGLSGIKILQELIYHKFEQEQIQEINSVWGPDMGMNNIGI